MATFLSFLLTERFLRGRADVGLNASADVELNTSVVGEIKKMRDWM